MNIFKGFISSNITKCDYKKPVWMNKRITLFCRKDQNLIKNTTMALQITTKICWLIRQMNVPGLLQKPKKKKSHQTEC